MARLGYQRYGAEGSDWGTSISTSIGQQDPGHVAGIHLVPPLAPPDRATFGTLTAREHAALASLEHSAEHDSGYSAEQATRPQTIGYALVDSPVALCAWIIEKFWAWTDCDGHLENVLTRDELLDNVMLYWLPGTGASAARLYWQSMRQVSEAHPHKCRCARATRDCDAVRPRPLVPGPVRSLRGGRGAGQEIAARTSSATFFSTTGLHFLSAYDTGHRSASSRFAASWKPRVE